EIAARRTLIIAELFKRERRAFAPRCVRRLRAGRARSNRARAARLVHRAPQPRAHGDRRDEHDGDDDERQPIRWRFDRLSLFTHVLKRTRARAVAESCSRSSVKVERMVVSLWRALAFWQPPQDRESAHR